MPIATIAAFGPVLLNGFINIDDKHYILENRWVQDGLSWEGLRHVLTEAFMGLYHPLGVLPLMVIRAFFGGEASAFHASSLAVHVGSTLLVLWLMRELTLSRWRSAMAAALFAVHPLRVESIAWASEMKDVLSVLFVLLAICAYIRYARAPGWRWMALTALLQALSLLAKPMFITLPLILLLLDYWPLCRDKGKRLGGLLRRVAGKWPLFAVSMADILLVWLMARGVKPRAYTYFPVFPLSLRLANVPISYERYVAKMIDIFHLAPIYPMPDHWPALRVTLDCVGIAGITAAALWFSRRHRHLLVGWLWFLIVLLPVIGFRQVSYYAMADRYTYLASLGLVVMVLWSLPDRFFGWRGTWVLILALSVMSFRQSLYWKDSTTLFSQTIDVTADNPVAEYLLGYERYRSGDVAGALPHLQVAARCQPDNAEILVALGAASADLGDTDAAIRAYDRALELDPGYPEAYYNLGNAVRIRGGPGALARSIECFQAALRTNPDFTLARYNLGIAFLSQGQLGNAANEFQEYLRRLPGDAAARQILSNIQSGQRTATTQRAN